MAVPPVPGKGHAATFDPHAIGDQQLALFVGQVRGHRAVSLEHPVPGHATAVSGQYLTDVARCTRADVLGDVAIGHHPTRRDRLDAGENARVEIRVDRYSIASAGCIALAGLLRQPGQ